MLQDDITLHLIATGLVHIAQQVERGEPALQYPYPASLQRGLNSLVASNLKRRLPFPSTVPELLYWCTEKPILEWGLQLGEAAFGERDVLLYDNTPTALCDEWAHEGSDIEADITETRFMESVFKLCEAQEKGADLYTAFRNLLATRRVLTFQDHTMLKLNGDLIVMSPLIDRAYLEAPLSCLFSEGYLTCGYCGNLLQPDRRGRPMCENDVCRERGLSRGVTLSATDVPKWLTRPLRRFVANPALAELGLAAKLRGLGLDVELWPQFDAYDLKITFPHGVVWAVDVKDWHNPFALARSVKPIPTSPKWTRAFFVFPDRRKQQREDYKRAFKHHWSNMQNAVDALYEYELLTQVRKELKKHA